MKQIDIHDLDKISYLAEDPEDKKVFAYIYNKQIRKKESGAVSTGNHFNHFGSNCELERVHQV